MDITIVGGGPGGLYLGILLKKRDPGHSITIHERNMPHDAYGFGVVFSDETLDNFDDVIDQLRAKGVAFEEVDFGEMGKTVDGVISTPDGQDKAAWFKDSEGNIISVSTAG